MDIKDLLKLLDAVNNSEIADFRLKEGEFELRITSGKYSVVKEKVVSQLSAAASPPPVSEAKPVETKVAQPDLKPVAMSPEVSAAESGAEQTEASQLLEIKSPIVGTFYRSSSPDKPAFVKVGDTIEKGSVVCIVEAMKLFNEIESEISGKIVKVMVEDASPVEYDQVLFLVEPA